MTKTSLARARWALLRPGRRIPRRRRRGSPPWQYLIGIGSNRRHGRHGRPDGVVKAALAALARIGAVEGVSAIRATTPIGPGTRRYANATCRISSALAPLALLAELKAIERRFGRRPGRRWGDRVLDLDILWWQGGEVHLRTLTVPHAELGRRGFVLDGVFRTAGGAGMRNDR